MRGARCVHAIAEIKGAERHKVFLPNGLVFGLVIVLRDAVADKENINAYAAFYDSGFLRHAFGLDEKGL